MSGRVGLLLVSRSITRDLLLCICVSLCPPVPYVCPSAKYRNNIEPINFNFGGSLPSDPGRNLSILKKKKKKKKKKNAPQEG